MAPPPTILNISGAHNGSHMPNHTDYNIYFGANENCTLANCDPHYSVYRYRPSLIANVVFMVLFAGSWFLCIAQSLRWRTWLFLFFMTWGYICEITGYAARIMLWQNPFSFPGFMIQIILLTMGPAFFSGAIYLTLSKIVVYLDESLSRIKPYMYYVIFVPCDLVSLTLQGAGGGLSTTSVGQDENGINVSLAGLCFQVASMTAFLVLAGDYAYRYLKAERQKPVDERREHSPEFKRFIAALTLSIVAIYIRCVYRIDELSEGYFGPLIAREDLFIGLEGAMIVVAVISLNACFPGLGTVFSAEKLPDNEASHQTNDEVEHPRETTEVKPPGVSA